MADAAGSTGPDAPVPSCPDWAVRDLVRHTGGVHRWATGVVADAPHRGLGRGSRRGGRHVADRRRTGGVVPRGSCRPGGGARSRPARPGVLDLPAGPVTAGPLGPAPGPRDDHPPGRHRAGGGPGRESGRRRAWRPTGSTSCSAASCPGAAPGCTPRPRPCCGYAPAIRTRPGCCGWTPKASRRRGWRRTGTPAGAAACTVSGVAEDLYLALWNRGRTETLAVEGDGAVLDAVPPVRPGALSPTSSQAEATSTPSCASCLRPKSQ